MTAGQPLHWVYDDNVMQRVTEGKQPEFMSPPANPFYTIPVGAQSNYGDQALVLLKSLAKCKGKKLCNQLLLSSRSGFVSIKLVSSLCSFF